jgi:hypothetical protein
MSPYPNGECPHCGSPLLGDGVSTILHCEFADDEHVRWAEPDYSPILCKPLPIMSDQPSIHLPVIASKPHYNDLTRLLRSEHADCFKVTEILASIMAFAMVELPEEKLVQLWHEHLCEPYLELAQEVRAGELAETALDPLDDHPSADEETTEEETPRVY